MTLNFPNSPSSGDQFTGSNNYIYEYDGEKWNFVKLVGGDFSTSAIQDGAVTTAKIADGAVTSNKLVLNANFNEVAPVTLSGSSVLFTGLPSTTYYIQLAVTDYSQNTDSDAVIQVGTSSGYVTSGYGSTAAYLGDNSEGTSYTSGFGLSDPATSLGQVFHFFAELILVSNNQWAFKLAGSYNTPSFMILSAGRVNAGATLDRIRLSTLSSATYDGGVAKLRYWSN